MDRAEILRLMVKEASDSGIIAKHTDLNTYTKVWGSFERIFNIVIENIEKTVDQ